MLKHLFNKYAASRTSGKCEKNFLIDTTLEKCFSHVSAFLFLAYFQMQVESSNSLHDRARLFSRIPPCIDLSAVTNCASETEKRWKSNGNQNGSNFNKPLHVKTSNIENTIVMKMGPDGLPLGKFSAILFILHRFFFNENLIFF
jgi:hypothetical protein